MRTRWWELVAGLGSFPLALNFALSGHLVRSAIASVVCLWMARRMLPRHAVLWLFAWRALRRWRLGPRAGLATIALGVKMNRLFRPVVAGKRLRHGRAQCGWAYALFVPTLRGAAEAHGALRKLSFYETSDTLALAQPLESLHDLVLNSTASTRRSTGHPRDRPSRRPSRRRHNLADEQHCDR